MGMNFAPNHPLHPDVCKCSDCTFGVASKATAGRSTTIKREDFEHRLAAGERIDFAPPPRTCRYCATRQHSGVDCAHCGAPDDGKRGPLEMASMRIIFA